MATSFFTSRAVIVTGGASGIGLETVRKLLKLSAVVHIVDRATSIPSDVRSSSNSFFYPSVDVTSRDNVRKTFQSILQKTPDIYGLVNSAGICPHSGGYIESDEAYKATMNVNVDGTWFFGTEFLRYIESSHQGGSVEGRGALVNVGSSASIKGFSTLGAYCASKHAVLGLTRTWALDFASKGVRVNLVAPGGTDTPLARAQIEEAGTRGQMSASNGQAVIPLGRLGKPDELADAIVYLLGNESSYITGQVLPVNGGYP